MASESTSDWGLVAMVQTDSVADALETPSGKDAAGENFPVGSVLIAPRLRPHVACFYAFARAIDDIADNPDLPSGEKIDRLDAFAAAVEGKTQGQGLDKAQRLYESLKETGVDAIHCLDLISAFKQDAVKNRYANWDELIDYCNRSAAPVGRYLLDLHGEDRGLWPANDALCNALQIINHLQDCADDYRDMDRVYLPQDWMSDAGVRVEALAEGGASAKLRSVLDRCIAGCRPLNEQARDLPIGLKSKRLAAESGVIVQIAHRLTDKLAVRDPLAERVKLQKPDLMMAGLIGSLKAWTRWR